MRINYHGLRFQVFLVVKLFVVCIAVAIYVVGQRPWVESFLKESYQSPPESLQPSIEKIRTGQSIQEDYQLIALDDRPMLFDDWMLTEPIQFRPPRILLETDYQLFSRRAERAVVCGSGIQRVKALKFFELSGRKESIPLLEKALAWSNRRKLDDLTKQIRATIEVITPVNLERD